MARVMFVVFAQRAVVDKFSNSLDLHNLIEQLNVPRPDPKLLAKANKAGKALPANFRHVMVIHWRRTKPAKPEGKIATRVEILSPSGKVIGKAAQEINLRQHVFYRTFVNFLHFPIVGEGTYIGRVFVQSGKRWRAVGEASYEVKFIDPPAVPATATAPVAVRSKDKLH